MKNTQGIVINLKMQKTAIVEVMVPKINLKYHKRTQVKKTYHVHNELPDVGIGDTVGFVQTRPYSKTKRWILIEVVRKSGKVANADTKTIAPKPEIKKTPAKRTRKVKK